MRIKTREITKELKEKGIKYNQYNARIKWVAKKLNIEPKRIGSENTYLRSEANQIIKYIKKGYKKVGRPAKKEIFIDSKWTIKYLEESCVALSERNIDLEKKIKDLTLENINLKEEIKRLTEKRRKF